MGILLIARLCIRGDSDTEKSTFSSTQTEMVHQVYEDTHAADSHHFEHLVNKKNQNFIYHKSMQVLQVKVLLYKHAQRFENISYYNVSS